MQRVWRMPHVGRHNIGSVRCGQLYCAIWLPGLRRLNDLEPDITNNVDVGLAATNTLAFWVGAILPRAGEYSRSVL